MDAFDPFDDYVQDPGWEADCWSSDEEFFKPTFQTHSFFESFDSKSLDPKQRVISLYVVELYWNWIEYRWVHADLASQMLNMCSCLHFLSNLCTPDSERHDLCNPDCLPDEIYDACLDWLIEKVCMTGLVYLPKELPKKLYPRALKRKITRSLKALCKSACLFDLVDFIADTSQPITPSETGPDLPCLPTAPLWHPLLAAPGLVSFWSAHYDDVGVVIYKVVVASVPWLHRVRPPPVVLSERKVPAPPAGTSLMFGHIRGANYSYSTSPLLSSSPPTCSISMHESSPPMKDIFSHSANRGSKVRVVMEKVHVAEEDDSKGSYEYSTSPLLSSSPPTCSISMHESSPPMKDIFSHSANRGSKVRVVMEKVHVAEEDDSKGSAAYESSAPPITPAFSLSYHRDWLSLCAKSSLPTSYDLEVVKKCLVCSQFKFHSQFSLSQLKRSSPTRLFPSQATCMACEESLLFLPNMSARALSTLRASSLSSDSCSSCHLSKPRSQFSKSQLSRSSYKRRCKACVRLLASQHKQAGRKT